MGWHKYKAQKTIVNGITFPSKLEAAVFEILLLREKAGEISDIKCQQAVTVKQKCPTCGDGPVKWAVDFSFKDVMTHERIYCEAKGVKVASYIKRLRLWKADPPARLEIWEGSWKYPKLTQVIDIKENTG